MSGRHRRQSPRRRRLPAAHWGLLGVLLVAMLLGLVLQGMTHDVPGSTRDSPSGPAADLPGEGPVLYADADRGLAARGLPERTVALTFDDGPDPRWTPQVLDLLARQDVPATFFVTGSAATDSPGLVRRALQEGHEVGNHSWSHTDLARQPAWRRNLELSLTQLGLAGSADVTSALFRPPHVTGGLLPQRDLGLVRQAAQAGYVVALADRVGDDRQDVTADEIVRLAGPVGDQGAVVLLHDGGGDRSRTLAALPALIDAYRDRGFTFTTLSGGLGLAPTAGVQPTGRIGSLQGDGLMLALRTSELLVTAMRWTILPLLVLVMLRTAFVVALARRHVRRSAQRIAGEPYLPAVSVLVPAYNEEVGIESAVRSLVSSDYPAPLEVLVIDDGSTDRTAEIVRGLDLPGVRLVSQANGGKAAALRTGTREAAHDVLVMLDGDTVFEPATIRHLVQPLRDPRVGAVSGNVKVGNRSGLLGRWQHMEYVTGFNLDRRLMDLLRCITVVPGAAGAFRRSALVAAGGLSTDTLAEDTDVTMAILRAGYEVVHEERALAWTEAPSTWNDLWKQRYRWSYGTMQVVWKHRSALREGGRLGRIALPYLLLFQFLLPVLAPVIDVFAVYGLVSGNGWAVATIWLGFLALQTAVGAYALHLDKESLRPLWALPLQQLAYRQLMYLVVIESAVGALSGIRLPWHKLERTGLDSATIPEQSPAAAGDGRVAPIA